jgi:hypothetical protein
MKVTIKATTPSASHYDSDRRFINIEVERLRTRGIEDMIISIPEKHRHQMFGDSIKIIFIRGGRGKVYTDSLYLKDGHTKTKSGWAMDKTRVNNILKTYQYIFQELDKKLKRL